MRPFRDNLTADELTGLLIYDPRTGVFTRRVARGRHGRHKAGEVAGHLNGSDGYIAIRLNETLYLAHRLAWLYMTGEWPTLQIDHKNLQRSDNRWENLREASHGENVVNSPARKNNTIGLKGVSLLTQAKRWNMTRPYRARITVDRKVIELGRFSTAEEAHATYMDASKKYFGEFARAE